jgi:hypothetical protein
LYSADHKFIKAILKHKFPFIELFKSELRRLRNKKNLEIIKNVYGEKTALLLDNSKDYKFN